MFWQLTTFDRGISNETAQDKDIKTSGDTFIKPYEAMVDTNAWNIVVIRVS